MKKTTSILLTLILTLSFSVTALSQEHYVKTKELDGETYVKLTDIKNALNFNYDQKTKNSLVISQQNSVKEVIDKVNQSVVAIIGENKKLNTEFLNDYYYSKIPAGLMHGSGIIISNDGRIITNNHVVADMKEIYVVLANRKAFKATLLYKNEDIDLALIKINSNGLKPIEFEKMKNIGAGDEVIAIGTPLYFGWSNSASKGIISGLNRPVDETYTYLQTDASINPGNSGGPLINMNGKLVGINTLGITYYQGINFSIPVENVEYFINQFNNYGKIRRAYTGLEFEESWLALVGIPSDQGLKIIGIKEDCILDKNKIKEGDILEAIDGSSVTSIASYNEILKKKLPEQNVKFTFSRDSNNYTVAAVLKEYPNKTNVKN
ncbi:MAG: 2-alkenal reductase [Parcubacteria group bacterium GW2011_GWF2_44_8]|nr:MAG: 2-alkenal reductase [Parcubacteria group bacterium GW2011_GWF2_44_8]